MKKFHLTLIALLLAITSVTAQEDISYGVIGGLNFSKIENLGGDGIDQNRLGFHAGGIVEIPFSERWSYEASLLYSAEGEEYDDQFGTKTNVKLQYVNLPFQVKYYAFDNISIHAGPQIGFLLKDEVTIGNNPTVSLNDAVSTSFAITAGFGYDLRKYNLYFKGTLAYGLNDVLDNKSELNELDTIVYEGVRLNSPQRIATLHLAIGYKF
jgi:hypothetical protein